MTRQCPWRGGFGASSTDDVPARYGPGYVLVRAPSRRSCAATARSPPTRRTTGLSRAQATRAIALLVHSAPGGLVQPFAGARVAHKEGWISTLRATAAIVYRPDGPRIVVVLAYRPNITTAEARALGRRVTAAALR